MKREERGTQGRKGEKEGEGVRKEKSKAKKEPQEQVGLPVCELCNTAPSLRRFVLFVVSNVPCHAKAYVDYIRYLCSRYRGGKSGRKRVVNKVKWKER